MLRPGPLGEILFSTESSPAHRTCNKPASTFRTALYFSLLSRTLFLLSRTLSHPAFLVFIGASATLGDARRLARPDLQTQLDGVDPVNQALARHLLLEGVEAPP